MIARCTRPSSNRYARYGGRGIRVCARWLDSYEAFLADVGRRPSPTHSLDRFPDNNGNYEPGNVRWATETEQQRNKNKTVWIDVDGERLPLIVAAKKLGVPKSTLSRRLKDGWTLDEAIRPART